MSQIAVFFNQAGEFRFFDDLGNKFVLLPPRLPSLPARLSHLPGFELNQRYRIQGRAVWWCNEIPLPELGPLKLIRLAMFIS